jgi:hypothetical protein
MINQILSNYRIKENLFHDTTPAVNTNILIQRKNISPKAREANN